MAGAASNEQRAGFSVSKLRAVILAALVLGVGSFTGIMVMLVDDLSSRFGPQVRADLEWRALRGAVELASTTDLGIALEDQAMVMEAFGSHLTSSDILEIVAVNAAGKVIAQHGTHPPLGALFQNKPGTIVEGAGYLASWQPVQIEGGAVGKVAVVVSTARLTQTQAVLARVSTTTLVSGALGLLFGILVLLYFTRAVVSRDRQLGEYAATLEGRVEDRTRQLDERNRGMQLVLDNVAQGFITIDAKGVMAKERSAVVDEWFGAPPPSATFADQVRELAPDFAAWFELSLQMLRDGLLPVEVCLGQLPRRFEAGARTYDFSYSEIEAAEPGGGARVLVIASEVTEQLAHERAEKEQRELLAVFQRIVADRASCEEFLAETEGLLAALAPGASGGGEGAEDRVGDRVIDERALHTLKGNCATFGFEAFAARCHQLEDELAEAAAAGDPAPLTDGQRVRLAAAGGKVVHTMKSLLGDAGRDVVELERAELAAAVELARRGGGDELAAMLAGWVHEPVARRFERLAEQARQLAKRLGKGELTVTIEGGGIRLDAARFAPLWTAMGHVIRNAIDHGIESSEERAALAKGAPHLTLAARQSEQGLVLSIADDGRGIDWEALRQKAIARGEAGENRRALAALMFEDGVSTRAEATQTSGRGVGLAAVRAAVTALGGRIEVESEPGQGARFELRFPSGSGRRGELADEAGLDPKARAQLA